MLISTIFLICCNVLAASQQLGYLNQQQSASQTVSQSQAAEHSALTGVYRIDIPASDKLYSVVAGASSNIPFGEQQRFFIDLAVRLTPPDLLAIEQHGTRISLGSSRAPRMNFVADGVPRSTRTQDGHLVRVRFAIENALKNSSENTRLVFTSSGRTEDNFTVVFESIDNGKRLRVVRRIAAEALDQPLVIQTIYNKISDVASWELYGETQVAAASAIPVNPGSPNSSSVPPRPASPATSPKLTSETAASGMEPGAANTLRQALTEWIAATNNRDIEKQMLLLIEVSELLRSG